MSDQSEFQRLEELYHSLSELSEGERSERLDRLRDEEPKLHRRLLRFLAEDGEAIEASLLDATGAQTESAPDDAWIGPYRLIRRLGEGGMGEVWEAEQESPLERRVALKLVRRGLDTERIVARFEAERSTLARLAHPGIAQVFDAGTAPDGRPYFVMELVEGEPITDHCDRRRLSTAERIALFREVGEAVQNAHQKGVLHRDLKPSNLLVAEPGGMPKVKVIDFGIAKLTDEGAAAELTRAGEVVGTPEYMSPEQTRSGGDDVDTRSDVYSLGVVLYELLTGKLPIDREELRAASPVEAVRLVAERPPTPPSDRLSPVSAEVEELAAVRRTDPARLRRELRGDLGRIVMMALRKEPERRYASVEQLCADLGRYLAAEPVVARPDSLTYRAGLLFRRHTAAAVSAVLLLLGLVVAATVSTILYGRAEAARRESETQRIKAERTSEFLTATLAAIDPVVAQGRDVSLLREILDDAAVRIDDQLTDLPEVAAELQGTVGRAYVSLGAEAEGERRLRASLELWRAIEPPQLAELASTRLALAEVARNADRLEEAETLARAALADQRAVEPPDPGSLVTTLSDLARVLEKAGKYDEAERFFREALELERPRADGDPTRLADLLHGYGRFLLHQQRLEEAESPVREAVERLRSSRRAPVLRIAPLLTLARWMRWSQHLDQAKSPQSEAVDIARQHLPPDHPLLAEAVSELANLHQSLEEYGPSEALYREALEIQRRVRGEEHSQYGTTANNLATMIANLGRYEEAYELLQRTEAAYRSSFGDDHFWVSIALFNQGRMLLSLGRYGEAVEILEEAARIRAIRSQPWQRAQIDAWLLACRAELGDDSREVAERLLEAIELLEAELGASNRALDQPRSALARLYERTGRSEEAAAMRARMTTPHTDG